MMKPHIIRASGLATRKLDNGIDLQIFLDKEEGAQNLAMGLVVFEPGRRTTAHTRDVEEVIYVLKGQAYVVTSDAEYSLDAGDSILIPAGIQHYHENRGDVSLEQLYVFAPQGPERVLRDLPTKD
jgi:quercetin dioxygenase-like cupin family protein